MIYAISDLHLDITGDKSMEVFGETWANYENRIRENWLCQVKEDDLVLIAGDISWALKLEEAEADLRRIESLPGKKILLKGNHDYWWKSLNKISQLGLEDMEFLQNNSFLYQGYNIGGTRGWNPRDSQDFSDKDEGVFKREMIRLDLSLSNFKMGYESIVMIHYPPFNRDGNPNEFHDIMKDYGVKKCIYGHLHAEGLAQVREGIIDGIEYFCTSADYLSFEAKQII